MADTAVSDSMTQKTAAFAKNIAPYFLIIVGFLTQFTTVVLLGVNAGSPDTNAEIRKYVGISVVPILISLILIGWGMSMYFSRYPQYVVFTAITASMFAIAIASLSLCIALIEKKL
jgi:uncharacterized membrane protein AbrB (regulator of aidB expression)